MKKSGKREKYHWVDHAANTPEGFRTCKACSKTLPSDSFHKHKLCWGGLYTICKECRKPISKAQWGGYEKEKKLYSWAMRRARLRNIEFSISPSDVTIPETCPVLQTPMFRPSLDRIDNSKGYIPGNVRVISHRANALKSNATLQEMRLIVADLEQVEKERKEEQ